MMKVFSLNSAFFFLVFVTIVAVAYPQDSDSNPQTDSEDEKPAGGQNAEATTTKDGQKLGSGLKTTGAAGGATSKVAGSSKKP